MEKVYFCGDDHLGLGAYGQSIRYIIEKSDGIVRSNDNESFVMGIDAPWGTGKTYFLRMLESYLNGKWMRPGLDESNIKIAEQGTGLKGQKDDKGKSRVIYYDAWSNDFWDNAFEPFYETVTADIAGYNGVGSEDLKKAFKTVGKIISIGFDAYLRKRFGDNYDLLKDMIETAKIGGEDLIDGEYVVSNVFPEYASFKRAIANLKKLLQCVVKEFQKRHGEEFKIVIIVDELDRCKPIFAVQTLEIIKHFFNIKGLVFVFALDISQLRFCVKSVYGEQFDAENYLERFFNYLSNLPQGNYVPIIKLFNQEALSKNNTTWQELSESLMNAFSEIAKMYSMSLRDVKIVLSSLQLLEQTVLKKHAQHEYARILYYYFLSVKYKKPELFKKAFLQGNLEVFIKEFDDIPYYLLISSQDIPTNQLKKKSQQMNEILVKVLVSTEKMKSLEMSLYNTQAIIELNETKDLFSNSDGKETIIGNKGTYDFSEHHTLNGLLFQPDITSDLSKSGELFEFTPSEYLNNQLEMINFVNLI